MLKQLSIVFATLSFTCAGFAQSDSPKEETMIEIPQTLTHSDQNSSAEHQSGESQILSNCNCESKNVIQENNDETPRFACTDEEVNDAQKPLIPSEAPLLSTCCDHESSSSDDYKKVRFASEEEKIKQGENEILDITACKGC